MLINTEVWIRDEFVQRTCAIFVNHLGVLKGFCVVYLSYFDESGDDGNPGSSLLYVQTAIYVHHQQWNDSFEALYEFRRRLKKDYGLPIRLEIHVKPFLLNKRPYQRLKIQERTRVKIIDKLCGFLATLPLKTLNVAIDKGRITRGRGL